MSTVLLVKWTTSRGRDTYGYNVVTLTDTDTHKAYRCMGGGYDMVGTVFGEWLADVHHDELTTLDPTEFYGLRITETEINLGTARTARLDGACGLESMRRVAKAIGLNVRAILDKRGNYEGFVVES